HAGRSARGCHCRPPFRARAERQHREAHPIGEPDWRIACIRLSDKTSRLHPRRATTKLGQAYAAKVLVKVREWISSALAGPIHLLVSEGAYRRRRRPLVRL